MRSIRKIFFTFSLVAFCSMAMESCWLLHGKNHCGDCPNFSTNGKPKKQKKHHH
ncbi:MAG: hypothetical protein HY064_08180 [Bacteroidetes bacterium]|nr:hypothetical protein [Bacteroidota bacterium]